MPVMRCKNETLSPNMMDAVKRAENVVPLTVHSQSVSISNMSDDAVGCTISILAVSGNQAG